MHSNVNQRAIRALMEILSVTDDPNFDDEVKAEELMAAREGKTEEDDEEEEETEREGVGKRKARLNAGTMEESGSDSSCSDEDEGISDDGEEDNDELDEDGEKKRKKTPKKKRKKKKDSSSSSSKKGKGGKDEAKGGGGDLSADSEDHDAKVKNMRSELRTNALQTGLLAYLRAQGESGDPTYSHAQRFYLAQWFKDAQDEAKVASANKNKSAKKVIYQSSKIKKKRTMGSALSVWQFTLDPKELLSFHDRCFQDANPVGHFLNLFNRFEKRST